MNIIEAKETLAKAHMCHMMPVFSSWCTSRKYCENCQLYVSDEREQAAYNYLYSLMERGKHETGN